MNAATPAVAQTPSAQLIREIERELETETGPAAVTGFDDTINGAVMAFDDSGPAGPTAFDDGPIG
jgi:hypothetical protein